jgi:hypothetical protein
MADKSGIGWFYDANGSRNQLNQNILSGFSAAQAKEK